MKIEKILEEFVGECKKKFKENLVSIVLFGSYARGEFKEESDVDLLVILNELPDSWKERTKLFEGLVDEIWKKYKKYIEIIPLTKEETLENLKDKTPLFLTFLLGMKVLYDSEFFTPEFRKFASEVSKDEFIYVDKEDREWRLKELAIKYLQ